MFLIFDKYIYSLCVKRENKTRDKEGINFQRTNTAWLQKLQNTSFKDTQPLSIILRTHFLTTT